MISRPRIAIPVPTSFDAEYNARTWPQYAQAVERSGGEALAIPLDDAASAAELSASCDGVLLPGSGADVDPANYGESRDAASAQPDPAREAVDRVLLGEAERESKPVLAICFGCQMLNVYRGGSLLQDLPDTPVKHRQRGVALAHVADVQPGSLLESAAGLDEGGYQIPVNSSHHQAIVNPGRGLRVAARSPDDGVTEAIEDTSSGHFLLGVQWHPERTYDESQISRSLFDRFVAEAQRWAKGRGPR